VGVGSAPKQPIKEADMKLCASEIAALNRPKTLDEILDSYLFSHARDLAKHTYLQRPARSSYTSIHDVENED
jgi:hypothetical protein